MLLMEMNSNKREYSRLRPRDPTHSGQEHVCEERDWLLLQAEAAKEQMTKDFASIYLDVNLLYGQPS